MVIDTRLKKISAAVFLILLMITLLGGLIWLGPQDISSQFEAIGSGRQLVIHSSSHGYIFGCILGAIFMLLGVLYMLPSILHGRELTKKQSNFLNKFLMIPFVISFVLMFVFHFVLNSYYRQQMAANGYQRCPDTALLLARVTYSAWVQDPLLCHDSDVRRIVRRGHWDESFQVEQMLQQRVQREAMRLERMQREAERQEARRQREVAQREQG